MKRAVFLALAVIAVAFLVGGPILLALAQAGG